MMVSKKSYKDYFTTKQIEVFRSIVNENPKITVCSGAKRAGKTYILTFAFLNHIRNFENQGLSFILGGSTQASLRRNVLDDMEGLLGKELRLNKSNAVEIFGNKVYCFDGTNSDSYKKVRGFTSAGAFLNEATTLHDSFVKEVISRCSYTGARIYMDTNPENPSHTVKKDYIDHDGQRLENGQLNIRSFHFTLFDNDKLDPEYVESIVASTPSGMFSDRDIYGKWVSAEGVVYRDFNESKHYVDSVDNVNFVKYFAGVDWGYEHHGTVVVIGLDDKGTYYLLEEVAKQHREIEWWCDIALDIKERYGNIPFYCDTARPEYLTAFRNKGLKAVKAKKEVLAGIGEVARLFKQDRFKIVEDNVELFKEEIYMYSWNERTGEPNKVNDDVLDSVRYAIYSDTKLNGVRTLNKSMLGI